MNPAYETVEYAREGRVARIVLNRPDQLNAFNPQMHRELLDALKRAERDPEIRAVLLGARGRAFCAGQDLETIRSREDLDYGDLLREGYNPIVQAITGMDKPVVAMVQGAAAGAGASLAFACDLAIASEKASFVEAFIHIGLVPDTGSSWFLPRLAGLKKAVELALLGDRISAAEAERLGLINRVVPPERLEEEALALAERLAAMPPLAVARTKRALYRGLSASLEETLALEARLQSESGRTEDHREGMKAFFEKRRPEFHGR
ncbi:MAG: enoyl-CoA hydratase/isomerase family protein [Kyrpidia tusciae]|nr:enoyl-CoA hydratase-related protein [Kyrpidia tusciae]MBE3552879.1 enoyl-CoA hydratase/isomerase family protein [Kyrpidia tusciae]